MGISTKLFATTGIGPVAPPGSKPPKPSSDAPKDFTGNRIKIVYQCHQCHQREQPIEMERYIWGFDGKKFSEAEPIRFVYGERLRMNMINDTMMDHPIHLHGMWMDLYAGGTLADNPRKHTVSIKPGELLSVDITADAPGRWAFHCHLLFHMDMGMFRTVAVVRSLEEEVAA